MDTREITERLLDTFGESFDVSFTHATKRERASIQLGPEALAKLLRWATKHPELARALAADIRPGGEE